MVFGTIIPSPRGNLKLLQLLNLADVYLENAWRSTDPDLFLQSCHDTEVILSQAKSLIKNTEDRVMRERAANAYAKLADLLRNHGRKEAQAFYKKLEKLGGRVRQSGQLSYSTASAHATNIALHSTASSSTVNPPLYPSSNPRKRRREDTVVLPQEIFPTNTLPPAADFNPPEPGSRLKDTPQLACCLGLLQSSYDPNDIVDPDTKSWFQLVNNDPDEQERLKALATNVVRAFKGEGFKDAKTVAEVVYLSSVLENEDFRHLTREFCSGINQSVLLDVYQLEGLARLVQGVQTGYLDADDLVKILELLSARLKGTHQQSTGHLYQLTLAVSHVLDAMADASVKDLDRKTLHAPLSSYLDELKGSPDAYLVYQAAYAYQALLHVPDNESLWQAAMRRTGKVMQGVFGLMSAAKGLDLDKFIESLEKIQQGLAGASQVVQVIRTSYESAASLVASGQGFFECMKEGFSFSRKCAWYPALRGADVLIRDGHLADFRRLICEAPCRYDPAFQWGVCQRLGNIASSSKWDSETRRGAIGFLGEMYKNDVLWGHQAIVKQWILTILMQLFTLSGDEVRFAEAVLQELQKNGDAMKQALYQECRENGAGAFALRVIPEAMGSPSLLDRVQERPDVEGAIRQLRRQRLKNQEKVVFIPPQAKANLQSSDEARFPLTEKVDEFLSSDRMVFLLLGDSGTGKSTFNLELESRLWQAYKKNGPIPLFINLPAIDKPEHDMIAKQLRKVEFTEPQIRELKLHREFVLICDGYDESQQTRNLYSSNRLNQTGEWRGKMLISCRSEYLGADYQDRFQPGDRNTRSESTLFQEAVITPFSVDQVQDYITQYVSLYRPLWEADEYEEALDLIPSLKELVKNPFMMSLSLEVLPRMIDPGQGIVPTRVNRTALYDQFIEHWLERGKKRLGEKNLSPQSRAAFEGLIDEGFALTGIGYLKKLCVAIYKHQDGQPIVTYSRYKDENSWKADFFSRDDEKQILREACPLIRNGNQHRFVHRSMLEYGVALAIFDPQDWKEMTVQEPVLSRRGSVTSVLSFDGDEIMEDVSAIATRVPFPDSPLSWKSFIKEPSVMQFLEERVQQEPLFKQQLLEYIEQSKNDKRWRTAAANAITILVRAGVQFNHADLRGIQIPKADLSYGVFDSTQLQGADLRQVDLRGAWLLKANLSSAQMAGVQFGELPFLGHEYEAMMCMYSPDGKTFAVGLGNWQFRLYSTSDWVILWTSEGHSMVYSPDSNQIASCSQDFTVRLWDIHTGVCLHVLNGHDEDVWSIAYSPQGHQLASAGRGTTIMVWDVKTGNCLHTLEGHTDSINSVVYSPNGSHIASGSDDSTVRLWNSETGECEDLCRHDCSISSVAYSPRGDQVASVSDRNRVRLWNLVAGEYFCVDTGYFESTERVPAIMYSPKGDLLASTDGRTVRLCDITTGDCRRELIGHTGNVISVVYSPQGDMVVSAGHDRALRLWDPETGVCRQVLTGHVSSITSVVVSPKGNQIASSSEDRKVRLWKVRAGVSRHVSSGHGGVVRGVACSPKGNQVVSLCENAEVRLWDVETGSCNHILRVCDDDIDIFDDIRIYTMLAVYSPQRDQIAIGGWEQTIQLWNVESGVRCHVLTGHIDRVNSIAYSPHGDQLASASDDHSVKLWDVKSGECLNTLTGHNKPVSRVAYSPNGAHLVSCSEDITVRMWDVETGICSRTLSGHAEKWPKIAFSPQGTQVASADNDGMVRLWNVETGECHELSDAINGRYRTHAILACSPKGDRIAYGHAETVFLWDTQSAACLQRLSGHKQLIFGMAFSPHGDLIACADSGMTMRIWDAVSGKCRAVIRSFDDHVYSIAWTQSSGINYLVAGSKDGMVGMWQVTVDGERCHVRQHWRTTKGEFVVEGTDMRGVQGLSLPNMRLMEQHGAKIGPLHDLDEANVSGTSVEDPDEASVSDTSEEDPDE